MVLCIAFFLAFLSLNSKAIPQKKDDPQTKSKPAKKPAETAKPAKKPAEPAKDKKPAKPAKKPAKKPAEPAKPAKKPAKKPAESAKDKKSAKPAKKPAEPAKPAKKPAKKQAEPAKPAKKPAEPAKKQDPQEHIRQHPSRPALLANLSLADRPERVNFINNISVLTHLKDGRGLVEESKLNDSLEILAQQTKGAGPNTVAIVNAANPYRPEGQQEGALIDTTTLYESLNPDHKHDPRLYDISGPSVGFSAGVRWAINPETVMKGHGFFSQRVTRNHNQKYEIPKGYAPFVVLSVAAVPAGQVTNFLEFQRLMTEKFDIMLSKAAEAGVKVVIFPIPGSGVFGGGPAYKEALMNSLENAVNRYHYYFDAIIFPHGNDVEKLLTK